ncbi:ATP-binding protein [Streptomyces avicenniae]|uniref:ATP-binding protein n=1 Tax=Streptomyces avicenniae TaxID=500153 RepID=UPI001CBA68AB|nr:ATP-binding protein [Streptomyces avicenniae]
MTTEEVVGEHLGRAVPTSAAAARHHVQHLLRGLLPAPGVDPRDDLTLADVLLVTSELVTNAIRHGGGVTHFSAEVTDDGLHLSVGDRSDAVPHTTPRTGTDGRFAVGGYGWPLIHRLGRDVAVVPLPGGGKTIRVVVPLG